MKLNQRNTLNYHDPYNSEQTHFDKSLHMMKSQIGWANWNHYPTPTQRELDYQKVEEHIRRVRRARAKLIAKTFRKLVAKLKQLIGIAESVSSDDVSNTGTTADNKTRIPEVIPLPNTVKTEQGKNIHCEVDKAA